MKISVLLEREPFDKIFQITLASFLNDYLKKPHIVLWRNKKIVSRDIKFSQKWLCNPLINSIFVRERNHNIFNSINGEYVTNPMKPWRSKIQRFYLYISQHKITAPILSNYRIIISPPLKDPKSKLIIGGNNKIRLIDLVENRVYVILKNGFDTKYIDKELYARENFKYLDIPKIYDKGNNAIWYSEEYVTGLSPNRIDSDLGNNSLNKVIAGIHRMLVENKVCQPLNKYLYGLRKTILSELKNINYLEFKDKEYIIDFLKKILNELNKYSNTKITTTYCHGDFHQGNILCDGNKNWILDWENSGQKQIGYDLLILLLESRITEGFHFRFSKLLNNQFDSFQMDIINNWPELNWKNTDSKKISLLLFLIEEIDFHIAGNTNPLFFNNSNKIIDRLNELKKCFESINLLES